MSEREVETPLRATVADARVAPIPPGRRSAELMRHGSFELRWYAPVGRDPQEPHDRDELYLVASGRGTFVRDGDRVPFGPGDCLFVPAGRVHRFEDFTADLGVWVVFWGPTGGERP
jgi:mannose-6-phosphate isomerase-like protein (cupin superfamily)